MNRGELHYALANILEVEKLKEVEDLIDAYLMEQDDKYKFTREVLFTLKSCHALHDKVYLHWIDKLNKDEQSEKMSYEKGEGYKRGYDEGWYTPC